MRKFTMLCTTVIACASFFVAGQAFSDNHERMMQPDKVTLSDLPDPKDPALIQKAEMMMMQLGAPEARHQDLVEKFVGEWSLTSRMWWGGGDGEPMVSKGTAKVEPMFGGRYLIEHVRLEFEMPGEDGQMMKMPFEGMSLSGYNKYRKVYESTWCDSMSTTILTSTGTRAADGSSFTYWGTMDEPALGVIGRYTKNVVRIVDKNTHVFEMYDLHAGDDFKVMEITYKRK